MSTVTHPPSEERMKEEAERCQELLFGKVATPRLPANCFFGGMLSISSFSGGFARSVLFGRIPKSTDVSELQELVDRKSRLLIEHPRWRLSREGEDPGAVRGKRYIVAVSGHQPPLSELHVLRVAVALGELTREEVHLLLREFPHATLPNLKRRNILKDQEFFEID
jgi:hypothetical protein